MIIYIRQLFNLPLYSITNDLDVGEPVTHLSPLSLSHTHSFMSGWHGGFAPTEQNFTPLNLFCFAGLLSFTTEQTLTELNLIIIRPIHFSSHPNLIPFFWFLSLFSFSLQQETYSTQLLKSLLWSTENTVKMYNLK